MAKQPTRLTLILAATVIGICAGYTIYWYMAAGEIRSGIGRWVDERRDKGWLVKFGEPTVTGFPFRLDLLIQPLVLVGPENRWRWEIPGASASTRPWSLTEIEISVPGVHTLKTKNWAAALRLDAADGELRIRSGQPQLFLLTLAGIDWSQPGGIRTRIDTLTLRAGFGIASNGDPANATTDVSVAIDARKVTLPEAWKPPLGTGLNRLSIEASVTGPFQPKGALRAALARWRDAGGALEVRAFALNWEALSLRGDGTFALDENLQPQGAVTAEIGGIEKTSDALIAAGVIDATTAIMAKVANRALSFGGGSTRLPISIQRQRLFLGPVPLFRLNSVKW